ncbi:MAG: hypothetical protein IT287_04535, partial [Bdellovibrionaceae bacterium]|nr:hypothetical protein [Pseudobdellovibrionaceae bacterium]
MKIFIFAALLISASLSNAQETVEAECEFSFLKVDGTISGLPQAQLPYSLTLKKIPSFPFQQKYGAHLDTELKLTDSESLKLKVYLTLIQGASLWFSEPKDRLQIEIGLLNSKDQVIGTFREHTDRVVRDYQILEIEKNKPRLQLALPVGMSWHKIYSNP